MKEIFLVTADSSYMAKCSGTGVFPSVETAQEKVEKMKEDRYMSCMFRVTLPAHRNIRIRRYEMIEEISSE